MEEIEKPVAKLPSQEIDYFKILKILLSRWYWVVGSVMICVVAAKIYLWYTPKVYATGATLKFEEKRSELSDLISLPGGSDRTNSARLQSESAVLQSNPILLAAIKDLDYRISFFVVGRVLNRTNELYPEKPINVQLVRFDSLNFFHDVITYRPINRRSFKISVISQGKEAVRTCQYDVPFTIGPTSFSITYPGDIPQTSAFLFKLNSPEDFIGRIRGGLSARETAKNSNIIGLQEVDVNPHFAADILNAIMFEYLKYDQEKKTESAKHTIAFIDKQLGFLSGALKGSGKSLQEYQNQKKIMDVSATSTRVLSKETDLEAQNSLYNVDLLAVEQLKREIVTAKDNPIPSVSLGKADQDEINSQISKINVLIEEKKTALKTYLPTSVYVNDLDQQILQTRNNLLNGLDATHQLIKSKIGFINSEIEPLKQQISELPEAQRDMVSLQRDFEINDKVYSFLSEKKLDEQISSAGMLPGATIIDQAQANLTPTSPDVNSIMRSSEVLGLAIGLGLIVLARMRNRFIYDKETIESLTSIPILGVIRKFPEKIDEYSSQILAISKPKSIFAESVRSVRTNLSFLATERANKVICITSEVAGEGKSFIAVNLSSTLSLIEKKVILIGADLRRSKLHKTFQVQNDLGLSNYLANQCDIEDIVLKSKQQNFDFIVSGPVPPNPSELLHSKKMGDLISELRKTYDFIMIDTAPIGLVSDAVPIIRSSDINVFVIRSGKSKLYSATVPQRLATEYHLDNTVIVLNAFELDLLHSRFYTTKFTGETYGSRYYYYSDYVGYEGSDYYLDSKKAKWWSFSWWFRN